MTRIFALLFLCCIIKNAFGQSYQNISADDISFLYKKNDSTKQYSISIRFKNNEAKPVLVYQQIEPGYLQNPWGNLFIELEKLVNGNYIPIVAYTSNTGVLASIHSSYTYDFPREILLPGATKTLEYPNQFTLFRIADLDGNVNMYRFKVHMRVRFESPQPSANKPNKIIYKTSDWFYYLPVEK